MLNQKKMPITFSQNKKQLAVLLDPDKVSVHDIGHIALLATKLQIDFFFIGGSIVWNDTNALALEIKNQTKIPLVLFPGNPNQLSANVDAILLLSLISGRNPDYLIHNHVIAAPFIHKHQLQTIPTGYMLIDGKNQTSVEYVSNTRPIPAHKTDIILATALAGQQMGMQSIYLEAGSGAIETVRPAVIESVKKHLHIPLIVGGGIKTARQLKTVYMAGADVAVIGNILEKSPDLLHDFVQVRNGFI